MFLCTNDRKADSGGGREEEEEERDLINEEEEEEGDPKRHGRLAVAWRGTGTGLQSPGGGRLPSEQCLRRRPMRSCSLARPSRRTLRASART